MVGRRIGAIVDNLPPAPPLNLHQAGLFEASVSRSAPFTSSTPFNAPALLPDRKPHFLAHSLAHWRYMAATVAFPLLALMLAFAGAPAKAQSPQEPLRGIPSWDTTQLKQALQHPADTGLQAYFLPAELPAEFVFDLDSGRAQQFWRITKEGASLVTQLFDERYRLQEYRKARIDERGAFLTDYATYWRDSSGSSVPIYAELGSPDLFYWDWPSEAPAMLSYREPRRMDARMASIRVDRERRLLPDRDTVLFAGAPLPVRFTSDFIRLAFYDKKGNAIGEDRFLELRTWGYGLGLISYVRRFGDGAAVTGRREED